MTKKLIVDENGVDPNGEGYIETFEEVQNDDVLTPEQIKEIQQENADLKSKNGRLEVESKDYKKKFQGKVSEEEKAKKDKLIADGKTEELLEVERKEKLALQDQLVDTKARAIRTKLENAILKLAPNCHDVNDVISNLDKEKYSIDTDTDSITGVEVALADVQKRKSYLFSLKKMPDSYNGGAGNNNNNNDNKKILTQAEYEALPNKAAKLKVLGEGRVEGLTG